MPKLLIDGDEIEVAPGTTLLQAAEAHGKVIPHFCYHPGLSIAGNCRMCLVEVEKAPKLLIACQTQAQDGMVVQTASEPVKRAQRAVMEFMLVNHPLDCPICDQAGECRLQEQSMQYGGGVSSFVEPKMALAKAVDIGRHVLLDQERCIHCSRCVRFCSEVSKTHELSFFQRGERNFIGIYPGRRLDNPYSGNVVDLCPVGALTLKEFRFRNRVWYLKNTPSICGGCARGCNIDVAVGTQQERMTQRGQGDDRIKRIVPRPNIEVNGHWICDEGRLSYQWLDTAPRLETARFAGDEAAAWGDAVKKAAGLLKAAGAKGRLGVIVSPRLTCESMHAWKELLESLGDVKIGVRRIVRGEDDELLIRADKGANSTGAAWIFGAQATEEMVLEAASAGQIDTLLVLGDPLDPEDTSKVGASVRARLADLIHVGPFLDGAAKAATVLLPVAAWAEEDGCYVNFEGRIQRVRRCHLPRGEGRPGWRVAADIGVALGLEPPQWGSAADVLISLAGSVEAFEGLTEEKIGPLGVRGAAAPAGA